jgi:spermidine synthase
VSASPYTFGWIAAGIHNPTGNGLMVGLGSGAGAVSLLFEFPAINLTVVEIDPVLVEVCLQAFPLVRYYRDQGRLNIVVDDISNYFLCDEGTTYDFILHDAYTGGKCMSVGGDTFYDAAARLTPNIWVNMIGKPHTGHMLQELHAMATAGLPPQTMFCADHSLASPFSEFVDMRRNWIVSSQETNPSLLDAYEPYDQIDRQQELSPESADSLQRVREMWDLVMANDMDVEDIQQLIACLDG